MRILPKPQRGDMGPPGSACGRDLAEAQTVVLDLTALLTLHKLNLCAISEAFLPRLQVVHSTLEYLDNAMDETARLRQAGGGSLAWLGSSVVFQETDREALERHAAFLKSVREWTAGRCDVVPVSGALKFTRERRQLASEMLGDCFADSVLAARQQGVLLYSDDALLRGLARTEFQVRGIWTQGVLCDALEKGKISETQYCESVLGLLDLNYRFTSVGVSLLLFAAEADQWVPGLRFQAALAALAGEEVQFARSLGVFASFAVGLYAREIGAQHRQILLIAGLEELRRGRDPVMVCRLLGQHVQAVPLVTATVGQEVKETVEVWLRSMRRWR